MAQPDKAMNATRSNQADSINHNPCAQALA
jgi:hypothetical protein